MVTSSLPMRMRPALGSSKPAIMRRVVVFPQPEGPNKVTSSPAATTKSDSWTATVSARPLVFLNRLVTPERVTETLLFVISGSYIDTVFSVSPSSRTNRRITPKATRTMMIKAVASTLASPKRRFSEKL